MKYEEFRKTIDEMEAQALDTVFSFAGKIYNDRFAACFELAELLKNIKEQEVKMVVNCLKIIPAAYVSASLLIMRYLNKMNGVVISKIREELTEVYVSEFKSATLKNKSTFAMFDKTSIESYLNLNSRYIDENEIIKLSKALNIKIDNVIGEYKGEDKTTTVLNKAMHRVRLFSSKQENENIIEKIIVSSLDNAAKSVQKFNKAETI